MKYHNILLVCVLVIFQTSNSLGVDKILIDGKVVVKELYELMGRPLVLDGLIIIREQGPVIQVISSDDIRYYCTVDFIIHDFGVHRELYSKMARYSRRLGEAKELNRITVLSPATKTTRKDGTERFAPLFYTGDDQKIRKYTLVYSSFLSADGATGLVIVDGTNKN